MSERRRPLAVSKKSIPGVIAERLRPPEPGIDHDAIERRVAQQTVDRFAEMLRREPGKYWSSPELQRQHRDAIAAATREEAPLQPVAQPAVAPSPPAAAPVPVKVAASDAARRTEIEAMMRADGGKGYWGDPTVQREYSEVLARLAGEAAPLPPQAPVAAPAEAATSSAAED